MSLFVDAFHLIMIMIMIIIVIVKTEYYISV